MEDLTTGRIAISKVRNAIYKAYRLCYNIYRKLKRNKNLDFQKVDIFEKLSLDSIY